LRPLQPLFLLEVTSRSAISSPQKSGKKSSQLSWIQSSALYNLAEEERRKRRSEKKLKTVYEPPLSYEARELFKGLAEL
jgi:hypothetical protein